MSPCAKSTRLLQASLDLILEWTPEAVQDYCKRLTSPLVEASLSLGFSVERDEWRADHLFGLRMPEGLDLDTLKAELESRNIYVSLRGLATSASSLPALVTWAQTFRRSS